MTSDRSTDSLGTFCLVLHSHLPWVAHHGSWPVGEEWLHQAWATSYLPITALLTELAEQGRSEVLTLGVTPVLAAQLDDPYCLAEQHRWLHDWQLRATGMAASADPELRRSGAREYAQAAWSIAEFESRWSRGGSFALRSLIDAKVIELLGGPATHPFLPLQEASWRRAALRIGSDDAVLRWGQRPKGLWAPECGYVPGLAQDYQGVGVEHFLVDGPTLQSIDHSTAAAWQLAGSDVRVLARDLEVTYRVWSPRRGYPGGRWYRDFHTFDHHWGVRTARVTGKQIAPQDKAPYDEQAALRAVQQDAQDFVRVVQDRLVAQRQAIGRHPIVVAAYDTELFGHWWHEGPQFLRMIVNLLPQAGIEVTTLRQALHRHGVAGSVELPAGSWGSGKDWRVWDGEQVADVVRDNTQVRAITERALHHRWAHTPSVRDRVLDQLLQSALLAQASDWAFMITKDSAAVYARDRIRGHREATVKLAQAILDDDQARAAEVARTVAAIDAPFGHIDARVLQEPLA
ncbi:MAG: 1,4-alpha-glucan branching protein domain-containing protein [Actinomycetales bacterium]